MPLETWVYEMLRKPLGGRPLADFADGVSTRRSQAECRDTIYTLYLARSAGDDATGAAGNERRQWLASKASGMRRSIQYSSGFSPALRTPPLGFFRAFKSFTLTPP